MNGLEMLELLTDIEDKYVEEAANYSVKKRKLWKVVFPIAAAAILVMVALSTRLFVHDYAAKRGENGLVDIYSLKGAKPMEAVPEIDKDMRKLSCPVHLEDIIPSFKKCIENEGFHMVYGTAKNMKIATVEELQETDLQGIRTHATWLLATFDIEVSKAIPDMEKGETIHVALVQILKTEAYQKLTPYTGERQLMGMLSDLQENPTCMFWLNEKSEIARELDLYERSWRNNGQWIINGKRFAPGDFADYYLDSIYECDGESFCYNLYNLNLDEIREKLMEE